PIDETVQNHTRAVHIRLTPKQQEQELIHKLALLLGNAHGSCDVYLHCARPKTGDVVVHATNACRITPSPQLTSEVETLLGADTLFSSAGMGLPSHQPKRTYEEKGNKRWRNKRRS
ncbi:MAG: hypothetical protein KAH38_10595, partial [Candidatus Hydrogenedentes bacterium]|nr:hypothetical protein [Candidatus Hydrogenedentota bacterium]